MSYIGLNYHYATFFPDRSFTAQLPEGGLEGYDEAAVRQRAPVYWGQYEISGGHGTIVFPKERPADKQRVWQVTLSADNRLAMDGLTYRYLDPCNGLRLQGVYQRVDSRDRVHTILFTRNGQFSDSGIGNVMPMRKMWNAKHQWVADDGLPGIGTYSISNNTLRLNYADGRVKQMFFFLDEKASLANPWKIALETYEFSLPQ